VAFAVVLDASVLYPLPLRDTLLRLAEKELYDPLWSERILEEVRRNLIADGRASEEQADHMLGCMRDAFDGACVTSEAVALLESSMTNDAKDRHVLAAAVGSPAQVVVTLNLKDFPESACSPHSIEVRSPDEFLIDLLTMDTGAVCVALHEQVAALRRSQLTVPELLDRLAVTVPSFAERARTLC
jgi:predicted nucleic acid-binding protein